MLFDISRYLEKTKANNIIPNGVLPMTKQFRHQSLVIVLTFLWNRIDLRVRN